MAIEDDDLLPDISSDTMPDIFDELHTSASLEADTTLANMTLFMRDAIWWREMCRAIAEGDTGRVWEILKVNLY